MPGAEGHFQEDLERVLDLQPSWATGKTPAMEERGSLIRHRIPSHLAVVMGRLAEALGVDEEQVQIQGKDGAGTRARVPWVRVADRENSPNAREGWYVVYLWAEDGQAVWLSLNRGTQVWDGVGMRPRPLPLIKARADWARQQVGRAVAEEPRLSPEIVLGRSVTSRAYEVGNVLALKYEAGRVPSDDALERDVLAMVRLLRLVNEAEVRTPPPGDPEPAVRDAEREIEVVAGRRSRPPGMTARERRAIELSAMALVKEHYEALGWEIDDVSMSESFDFLAKRGEVTLHVEVKGTTGRGDEVVLTRNEVALHKSKYPDNALAVVSGIVLTGSDGSRKASGGRLVVWSPWLVDDDRLSPLAFAYRVPRLDDGDAD